MGPTNEHKKRQKLPWLQSLIKKNKYRGAAACHTEYFVRLLWVATRKQDRHKLRSEPRLFSQFLTSKFL